jgi:hypothetical protein
MKNNPLHPITEAEALQMLGYTNKYVLRRNTRDPKRKTLPIRTAKLNSTTILYSKLDIENYINQQFEKPV